VALGNTITNNLYRYETGVGYAIYPTSFTSLTRGRGYWLYLTNVQPSTVVSVAGQVATGSVSISVPQGWSIVGHPFPQPTLLANCQLSNGITTQSWAGAVAAGWVSHSLYYWDQDRGYLVANVDGYGNDTSLRPWRGYWLWAGIAGLSLIVPVTG